VATVVISAWEGELDRDKMNAVLNGPSDAFAILREEADQPAA